MELAFLIIAFFAFVGGGAALLVGMAGHRVGSEPFCRKCNYNLTNLESPQCPECGVALTPIGILIGVHRRRPRAIFLGVCTLIFGAACVVSLATGFVNRLDPYRALPLRWLVARADKSDRRALAELSRRVGLTTLSASDAGFITAAAIRHIPAIYTPGAGANGPVLQWLFLLDDLYQRTPFSQQEFDAYVSSLGFVNVVARPVVRKNDSCPVSCYTQMRRSNLRNYQLETDLIDLRLDGKSTHQGSGSNTVTITGAESANSFTNIVATKDIAPGRHTVAVDFRRSLLGPTPPGAAKPELVRTYSFDVTVLPLEATDPVRVRAEAALNDAVNNSLMLNSAVWRLDPAGKKADLQLQFSVVRPIPIDLAFDVIVSNAGRSDSHASMTIRKNTPLNHGYGFYVELGPEEPDEIRIVLRGSRDVAAQSADIFECWKGDLEFGPFKLAPGKDWSGQPILEYRYMPTSK